MSQSPRRASLWACLFALSCVALMPSAARANPPTAALFRLATADGTPATAADITVKVGLMSTQRYIVTEAQAPDTYNIGCVRSFFCLKALADTQDTDRLIAGLIEAQGGQLKVYLVLFDTNAGSTLKAAEARMPPAAVGERLPELVAQLVADEPRFPPEAFVAAKAPPPEPTQRSLDDEGADVVEALADGGRRRDQDAGGAEFDDDLGLEDDAAGPFSAAFQASLHVGGAYVVGYPLLISGLDLEGRTQSGWVFGLSGQTLNGYDATLNTRFYLLSVAPTADRLLGDWGVVPFAGVEGKVMILAPGLTAVGGSLRGGAIYPFTQTLAARALVTGGVLYNGFLPETIFELKALQFTGAAHLQIVFTLI